METIEAILSRRSIRKYTPQPVSAEELNRLLEAAMSAPSALDERPWHFVVISQKESLKRLEGELENCSMLGEAALGVLVCGDEALEKLKGFGYWVQDCSACTQNILLAAHAMGLGAVWIAVYPIEARTTALRNVLGIPEEIIPFALVALGRPAEFLPPEQRYDAARVHEERWSR